MQPFAPAAVINSSQNRAETSQRAPARQHRYAWERFPGFDFPTMAAVARPVLERSGIAVILHFKVFSKHNRYYRRQLLDTFPVFGFKTTLCVIIPGCVYM